MIDFYRTVWAESNRFHRFILVASTIMLGLFASAAAFLVLSVPLFRVLTVITVLFIAIIGSYIYLGEKWDDYHRRKSYREVAQRKY